METMELSSWANFKALIAAKSLTIQYSQIDNYYNLFAPEAGTFLWHYTMPMDGGSDQTDFETNYKPTANPPLEIKAGVGRPIRVSSSPQPAGTVEHWKGFQIVVPAGTTSSYVDINFSSTVYLKGGYIVSPDVDYEDTVQADVLVAANGAEYLPGLISSAYMIPNLPVSFESDESMAFPSILKIRVTLTLNPAHLTDTHANILVDFFE